MPRRCCWLTLLLLTLVPIRGSSCSIPVFRYALERWKAAPYEIVVFHRGPLAKETRDRLSELEQITNLTSNLVDLADKVEPGLQKLWQKFGSDKQLPWVVVRFPASRDKEPLWAGSLNEQTLGQLVDSPARQKIVASLTQGDSTVLLLLTSGDQKADDATLELLQRQADRLREKIRLPEQGKEGPQLRYALPLKVSFAIQVLSRHDLAEQLFVQMLLRGDEDLTGIKGPIVFPIFGQGRMLTSFYGDDLTGRNLEEAAGYLCAACSCQVKEENPGADLLLSAPWGDLLTASAESSPSNELERIHSPRLLEEKKPVSVSSLPLNPDRKKDGESHLAKRRGWLWPALIGAAGLVVMTGSWALRSRARVP